MARGKQIYKIIAVSDKGANVTPFPAPVFTTKHDSS